MEMERQRSFSFKPTGLLLFSFAASSSLLFCLLVSLWPLRSSSSARETHLQFASGLKPPVVLTRTASNPKSSDGQAGGSTTPHETRFIAVNHSSSAGGYGFVRGKLSTDTHWRGSTDSSGEVAQAVRKEKGGVLAETHSKVAVNSSQKSADSGGKRGDTNFSENSQGVFGDSSQQGVVVLTTEEVDDEGGGHEEDSDAPNVGEDSSKMGSSMHSSSGNPPADDALNTAISFVKKIESGAGAACEVSSGKWVLDESYPLYTNNSCPFIDEGFNCENNGRLDRDYMKWRWQPHACNTPRFDAVKMLELIRGKRLVFVGDSINRNQWESMLCLLSGVSDPNRVYEAHGRKITKEKGNYNFKFADYHSSVEYYVTHFLVRESKARIGTKRKPTLRIDTIDRGSSNKWRGADILVFNTAHWWSHYKTKAGVNYFREGDQVHPHLDVMTAFRRALMTWASWVDKHATPGKTQVFFRTSSPSHFRGGEWNSGGHCMESTQPLNETIMARGSPEMNIIAEEVIKQMRTPVTLLNITMLSGLRIDGHPSIYGRNPGSRPPRNIQDCSHWCLPGVPDTWNELLYFYLLSKQNAASVH